MPQRPSTPPVIAPVKKKNKIKVGLPMYGSVPARWFQHWIGWQGEIGRLARNDSAGMISTEMPYVDRAQNVIVDTSLGCTCGHGFSDHIVNYGRCMTCECAALVRAEEWDYLILIEHDNIIPEGWISRVQEYDKPIVALMYFGKAYQDQRPIPGYIRNRDYVRVSYEEVEEWAANPGFYEVDVVGMGATAIRRDVLEHWNPFAMPWFQTTLPPPNSIRGQDVNFCMEARKQGHKIFVDSHLFAGHIGTWESTISTFRDSNELFRYRKLLKDHSLTLDQLEAVVAGQPIEEPKDAHLLLPAL